MLLAERLRNKDECSVIKGIIEKHTNTKIDLMELYGMKPIEDETMVENHSIWTYENLVQLQKTIQNQDDSSQQTDLSGLKSIALTYTLQKLFKLIGTCLENNESVLLVGETGGGKTTAVQLVAQMMNKELVILNWYIDFKEKFIFLVMQIQKQAILLVDCIQATVTIAIYCC